MTQKKLTVEEFASEIASFSCRHSGVYEKAKQALLSFAAQEAEPLCEAIEEVLAEALKPYKEHNKEVMMAADLKLKEALTAHRAKYPKS